MSDRRALQVGAIIWAIAGLWMGITVARGATDDARAIVYAAAVAGPAAAVGAAFAVNRRRDHLAGSLLLVSAMMTPTGFAYVLNIPAFVVGLLLIVRPRAILRDRAAVRA